MDQSTATLVEAFSPQGLFVLAVPPPNDTQFGNVTINGCSSTFTFEATSPDGTPLAWEMTPKDWTGKNGAVYTGSMSPMAGMTFNSTWTIGNPYEAVGVLEIVMKGGGTMATGSPAAFLQSVGPVARTRYECRCKDHLQDWLDEQIAAAAEMRDVYANPKFQERPPEIPPNEPGQDDNWNPTIYDAVIDAMIGDGMSHSQAVKSVVKQHFPNADAASDPSGNSDSNAQGSANIVVAAETDMLSCKTDINDAYRYSCYPDIEYESTDIHEGVHRKTCWGNQLTRGMSVAQAGQDEVKAYQAEIDYLSSFIQDNCQ